MRTDFTLLGCDGSSQDIAVISPDGTTFAELTRSSPLLAGVELVDGVRISGDHRLGCLPLRDGAVLAPVASAVAPARTEREVAVVEVVGGLACGAAAALGRAPLVVGRAGDCDLVLSDPRVSRRHLEWRASPSGAWVRDLGSTHGTVVDGRRLLGATRVDESSVVRVGDSLLQLRRGEVTGAPTAPGESALQPEPGTTDFERGSRRRVRWAVLAPALVTLAASAAAAAVLHAPQLMAISGAPAAASLAVQLASLRRQPMEPAVAVHPPGRDAGQHVSKAAARPALCDPAALLRRANNLRGRPWATPMQDVADESVAVRVGWAEPCSERVGIAHAVLTLPIEAGVITVVAPEAVARGVVRWFLIQLSVWFPPGTLVVGLDSDSTEHWQWLRWLPQFRRESASPPEAAWTVTVFDRRGHVGLVVGKPSSHPAVAITLTASEGRSSVLRFGDRLVIADCASPALAEKVARALATRPVPASGSLPRSAPLLELVGVRLTSVGDLLAHWAGHTSTARIVVGLAADGRFALDLDRDGPHLLVAGTTGSGKSEFLQTLVAALALELPPSELTFLLIDYKGGAALGRCAQLPHCVGLVTDLDPPLARRLLRSLDYELRRREAILEAAGVPDRSALLRAGGAHLPRLVVVVDEFAVLAEQAADVVAGLVGVARRGRSLGVHLVMATQRPGGAVSSEIRANTGVQVAFRTITAADSADVVGTADAARLDAAAPGRAVIRTPGGVNLMQAARVAGTVADRAPRVIRLGPWRELPGPAQPPAADDLDAVLTATNAAARRLSQCRPRRPWLTPLPTMLWTRAPHLPPGALGVVELLAEQRRAPLLLPERGACWLVTGKTGSGRSTAAVAAVVAAAFSPAAVQVHVIAQGADRSPWQVVRDLPGVGTVIDRDDVDLVARLAALLGQEVAAAQHSRLPPARWVLVVDGWDSLAVVSGELDGGRTAADLLGLAQAVRAAGGMVVLTATRPLGGLTALADERFLLTAPDAADYLAAGLPRDGVPVAAVPGRAVRAGDGAEIQFALPDPAAARGGLPDDRIGYRAPVLVRKLPSRVPPPPHRGPAARWLLGVVGDRATELYVEPTALGLQMLVIGPPRSGLTSVLAGMLDQCGPGIALVAAGRRSWLPAAAAARGADAVLAALPCAGQSAMTDAPEDAVLLVDDAEVLDDTPLGEAVTDWLREGRPAVLAAHTDAVGAAFRGPLAALRRAGCGALLRPGPADGELLGVPTRGAVRIPRRPGPPGRGLLVPGSSRLPVPDIVSAQLVTSDPVVTPGHASITACGDTCGPMAERRSP